MESILTALIHVGKTCVALLLLGLAGCDAKPRSSYSLANDLPDTVEVLNSFSDTSGMDAFHMLKVRYSNDGDLEQIIETFQLLPDSDGVSDLSVAEIFDQRAKISWFPLPTASEKLEFNSLNDDGTLKAGAEGSYENAMWLDRDLRLFIIQSAAL